MHAYHCSFDCKNEHLCVPCLLRIYLNIFGHTSLRRREENKCHNFLYRHALTQRHAHTHKRYFSLLYHYMITAMIRSDYTIQPCFPASAYKTLLYFRFIYFLSLPSSLVVSPSILFLIFFMEHHHKVGNTRSTYIHHLFSGLPLQLGSCVRTAPSILLWATCSSNNLQE